MGMKLQMELELWALHQVGNQGYQRFLPFSEFWLSLTPCLVFSQKTDSSSKREIGDYLGLKWK